MMKRNMKKIATVLLVAMMAMCLMACGGKDNNAGTVEIADAAEILTTVWGTYEEDEMFPVGVVASYARYGVRIKRIRVIRN